MPQFDVKNPLLADLDLTLQNLEEAVLAFNESEDIAVTLFNAGTAVMWTLKYRPITFVNLDDASALPMTTNTPVAVVQLTVPVGKRMVVTGAVVFKPGPTVTSTFVAAGCGVAAGALPEIGQYTGMPWSGTNAVRLQFPIPERVFDNRSGGADVIVTLVAQCTFSAGAVSVSGWLRGRVE